MFHTHACLVKRKRPDSLLFLLQGEASRVTVMSLRHRTFTAETSCWTVLSCVTRFKRFFPSCLQPLCQSRLLRSSPVARENAHRRAQCGARDERDRAHTNEPRSGFPFVRRLALIAETTMDPAVLLGCAGEEAMASRGGRSARPRLRGGRDAGASPPVALWVSGDSAQKWRSSPSDAVRPCVSHPPPVKTTVGR